MDLELSGKTALITGGSQGIGLAVARGLAAEGVNLHLASRTQSDLDKAADEIRDRHNVGVTTHATDLGVAANVEALANECSDVDILINNAGAIPGGGIDAFDVKRLKEVWELKVFGYYGMTHNIYAAMKERGSGVIVNVIGAGATLAPPEYVAGAMANIALQNLTISVGKESTKYGVRVCGVHPAATMTERLKFLHRAKAERELGDPERWAETFKQLPFDRATTPEEVADLVVFLASARAGYVSGVVWPITGGV